MAEPFWAVDLGEQRKDGLLIDQYHDWLEWAGPWDLVVFNGKPMPGLATVTPSSAMKVDEKKGAGNNGATPTFHGRTPAEFEVKLVLWTAAQLEELETQMSVWWPKEPDRKEPTPHDIYHPNLALLGIKSAFPVKMSGLTTGPVSKAMTISIGFREFRKPKPGAKKKPITPPASVPNNNMPERLKGVGTNADGTVMRGNDTPVKPSQNMSFWEPRS
jgi:hypothetical protein